MNNNNIIVPGLIVLQNLKSTLLLLYLYRKCLAFVSVPLLTKDLVEFVSQWNTHPIRRNHLADCPGGIPVDIYEMPVEFGKVLSCV